MSPCSGWRHVAVGAIEARGGRAKVVAEYFVSLGGLTKVLDFATAVRVK
jgi:hypothetical protein